MQPQRHAAARCQDRERCTGGGCRVKTGKTRRKAGGWGKPFHGHRDLPQERDEALAG